MLLLIILGSLTYGGYYLGKQTKIAVTPTPETVIPSPIVTPSQQLMTIVAGLPKSAGLSFDQYSIMAPNDWISKKEAQTAMDEKLILEKDGYSISIFQAATGGALCLYPGDAEFEGPVSKFEIFTDLTTKDNRTLRKGGNKNDTTFTVCQKSADGSYQQPTNYGHISVKLPANYTPEISTEIDSIISSLKKI